jgi:hypothetical protein
MKWWSLQHDMFYVWLQLGWVAGYMYSLLPFLKRTVIRECLLNFKYTKWLCLHNWEEELVSRGSEYWVDSQYNRIRLESRSESDWLWDRNNRTQLSAHLSSFYYPQNWYLNLEYRTNKIDTSFSYNRALCRNVCILGCIFLFPSNIAH